VKETEIRDLKKVKLFFKKETEWVSQFIDNEGKIKGRYTKSITCPCCGNRLGKHIFTKNSFNFDECQKCLTIYVNPRFNRNILDKYYKYREKRLNYQNIIEDGKTEHVRKKEIFTPRCEFIERTILRYGKKINECSVLDVGCASGQFLSVYKERNDSFIAGVEPSRDLAEKARSALPSAEILTNSIENCDIEPEVFDIVTLWEVLEHTYDPVGCLRAIERILKPDGLIFLSLPNMEGFDIQILWDKGNAFSPPSHLNYYRKSTIYFLFESVDLHINDINTPGQLDVDIVRNRIDIHPDVGNRLGSYWTQLIKRKNTQGKILRENLQKLIQQCGLSSHMMIVCSKKIKHE
jgi:2-polyprenyl-3-methyl-5-hydroxy-6-metoxy-1,4-benzoquinol methylase